MLLYSEVKTGHLKDSQLLLYYDKNEVFKYNKNYTRHNYNSKGESIYKLSKSRIGFLNPNAGSNKRAKYFPNITVLKALVDYDNPDYFWSRSGNKLKMEVGM